MKEVLQKELDFISNDVIHDFVSVALDKLPEYFWSVPASSSGKYHPSYALGNGGLVRHTIAAVNIADILFNLEQYQKIFDSDTRDCIYAGALSVLIVQLSDHHHIVLSATCPFSRIYPQAD